MPNFMLEREDSPRLVQADRGESAVLRYNVYGMTDQFVAHALLIQDAPALVTMASGKQLVPTKFQIVTELDKKYVGEVQYAEPGRQPKPPPATNSTEISFTIAGEMKHVEKSLETNVWLTKAEQGEVPGLKIPPDFERAVNVTEDRIEGTDILRPEFRFNITKYVPIAAITDAWVKTVADLVGTVNNDTFRSFHKGEVLLTSVSGATRSKTDAAITYQFARNKNETWNTPELHVWQSNHGDLVGGNTFTRQGWETLWFYIERTKDDQAKKVIRRVISGYVERMYSFGNFAILGV